MAPDAGWTGLSKFCPAGVAERLRSQVRLCAPRTSRVAAVGLVSLLVAAAATAAVAIAVLRTMETPTNPGRFHPASAVGPRPLRLGPPVAGNQLGVVSATQQCTGYSTAMLEAKAEFGSLANGPAGTYIGFGAGGAGS